MKKIRKIDWERVGKVLPSELIFTGFAWVFYANSAFFLGNSIAETLLFGFSLLSYKVISQKYPYIAEYIRLPKVFLFTLTAIVISGLAVPGVFIATPLVSKLASLIALGITIYSSAGQWLPDKWRLVLSHISTSQLFELLGGVGATAVAALAIGLAVMYLPLVAIGGSVGAFLARWVLNAKVIHTVAQLAVAYVKFPTYMVPEFAKGWFPTSDSKIVKIGRSTIIAFTYHIGTFLAIETMGSTLGLVGNLVDKFIKNYGSPIANLSGSLVNNILFGPKFFIDIGVKAMQYVAPVAMYPVLGVIGINVPFYMIVAACGGGIMAMRKYKKDAAIHNSLGTEGKSEYQEFIDEQQWGLLRKGVEKLIDLSGASWVFKVENVPSNNDVNNKHRCD